MNTRKRPCAECPWRRDIEPGQFPAERYEELRNTTGSRGKEVGIDAPIFACHKSTEGQETPCAGWLAAVGFDSLGVRIAAAQGRIPPEALRPGPDWPPLFDNYEEMAEFQSGPEGARSVCLNSRCPAYRVIQTVTPGFPCPTCKRAKTCEIHGRPGNLSEE